MSQTVDNSSRKVTDWLAILDRGGSKITRALAATYGSCPATQRDAIHLMRETLLRYRDRFGDAPVRIYRAPGRINLRGMHVDTHGGYLNLMSHQREIIVVAGQSDTQEAVFVNVDSSFREVTLRHDEARDVARGHLTWDAVMQCPAAETLRRDARGCWSLYLWGALIRASVHLEDRPLPGLNLAVGSNLPTGAGLSSSASLCLAALLALTDAGGDCLTGDDLILAARDAEWFTGARTGTCDQAAEVLGKPGHVAFGALLAEDFSTSGIRYYPFPDTCAMLVINTYTRRNLSGAQLLAYTTNRFAYSMAMHVLRAELGQMGVPRDTAFHLDRFSRLLDEAVLPRASLVELLLRLPDNMTLDELRARYAPDDQDALYTRYFGDVPEENRPRAFSLRGPLLYGIAESARAEAFADAMERGDIECAGHLMRIGHDGDRVVGPSGEPYNRRLTPEEAIALKSSPERLPDVPGDYGASSPVLDGVVDAALAAGALGSSLTGAGLAGSVLALTRTEDEEFVADHVRSWLSGEAYAAASGNAPLSAEAAEEAVLRNVSPAGAAPFSL